MVKEGVSALAVAAKGNPALMEPLWEAVCRLVCLWANKYNAHCRERGTRLYEIDDLIQAGYLAMVDAVAGYDPEAGAFSTYLQFHVRRRFQEVLGFRTSKRHPEMDAVSLSVPLVADGNTTLADTLADPAAEFADEVVERESNRQAYAALMAELDKLPEEQQQAVLLNICRGLPLKATAAAMGCEPRKVQQQRENAIRALRHTKTYRKLRKAYLPVRHVGLSEFRTTGTSAVEWSVLWAEEREGRTSSDGD